jgi:hypothetical protein
MVIKSSPFPTKSSMYNQKTASSTQIYKWPMQPKTAQ